MERGQKKPSWPDGGGTRGAEAGPYTAGLDSRICSPGQNGFWLCTTGLTLIRCEAKDE